MNRPELGAIRPVRMYGKNYVILQGEGGQENPVPVRVDEYGRLVLASDVIVDVGDITLGTVEQGGQGLGVSPWQTQLYGPDGELVGDNNPLEVRVRELETKLAALQTVLTDGSQKTQLTGTTVAEQLDETNEVAGDVEFAANISAIEIYNKGADGTFTVNGFPVFVPGGASWRGRVSGVASDTVSVADADSYEIRRLV